MQYRSVTSAAVLALASTAAAKDTLVFTRASQSLRELGVFGRNTDGYQPEDEVCAGEGSTCTEACGTGYEQCYSADSTIHCYNPESSESCCSGSAGASCLAEYYCSHDSQAQTFCCPEGSDLEQCASEFGVAGPLTSDAAEAEEEPTAAPQESSPAPEAEPSASPSPEPEPESDPSPEPPSPSSDPSPEPSEVYPEPVPIPETSDIVDTPTSDWDEEVPQETTVLWPQEPETDSLEPTSPVPIPTAPEEEDNSPAPFPTGPVEEEPQDDEQDEEGDDESDDVEAAASVAGPTGVTLVVGAALVAALF